MPFKPIAGKGRSHGRTATRDYQAAWFMVAFVVLADFRRLRTETVIGQIYIESLPAY